MTSFPTPANAGHWWLTTVPRWKRLHAVPGEALDAGNVEAVDALCGDMDSGGLGLTYEGPWPVLTTVCGRTGPVTMPGVLSRLSLPRCARCCRKLGIGPGNGTPANEARRVLATSPPV